MTALNLTPASERGVEYILDAVQCYAHEWRTATMSSRNREAAHARAQATLTRIRTMLDDDAGKLERAALAQPPAPLPKWIDDMKGADPTLDGVIEYFEGRSPVSAEGLTDAELPLLPSIPRGDRFEDNTLFRHLGRGGNSDLYECWDDAIYKYAQDYARAAIAAADKGTAP